MQNTLKNNQNVLIYKHEIIGGKNNGIYES